MKPPKPMPTGMDILKAEHARRDAGVRAHRRRMERPGITRQSVNRHRRLAEMFELGVAVIKTDIGRLDSR